jgi:hypothetical protein
VASPTHTFLFADLVGFTVDYGERELHWLRNVTEPIATYLLRARDASGASVRATLACALGRTVRTSEVVA